MIDSTSEFVDWFRGVAPYVHRHRDEVFVFYVDGALVDSSQFRAVVHDLALLNALGIRLAVVFGVDERGAQVTNRFERSQLADSWSAPVDESRLASVVDSAGRYRFRFESEFSTAISNSPMADSKIRIVSGNYVIAKPLGVRDGVDYRFAGQVRRLDTESVASHLASRHVVLLPPVGFSASGELLALEPVRMAADVALALGANKLLLMTDIDGIELDTSLPCSLNTEEARAYASSLGVECDEGVAQATERYRAALAIDEAARAVARGLTRVHIVPASDPDQLLKELFTADGAGIMVNSDPYDALRTATLDDLPGIIELISPLEATGELTRRPREKLEQEIEHFIVMERDGMLIGCAAAYPMPDRRHMELACLAIHPDYRQASRGDSLLDAIERLALTRSIKHLFVLTTHTAHWFMERGFAPIGIEELPSERVRTYNRERKSRVLRKTLSIAAKRRLRGD